MLNDDVSNIQLNSRDMYSSNITSTSDTSSFSTSCSKSPEINPTTPKKVQVFLWETIKHRRWWLVMRHGLQLQSLISLIMKVFLPIYLRNLGSIRVLDLEITVSKSYQPPNRNILSKDILDVVHDQNTERKLSLIKTNLIFFNCYFYVTLSLFQESHYWKFWF